MKWETVGFLDALEDITSGKQKVPQREMLDSGTWPVVDQGRALIAGYTNDQRAVVPADTPTIVFGDHTRALKYVDFPFAMGADGTKLLRTRAPFDPKFVFRFLQSLEIPSAGYSRHFKFLKKTCLLAPPLEEQRRIAAILDQADEIRQKRRAQLAHLDELPQALFHEMFGRLSPDATVSDIAASDRGAIRTGPFGSQLLHEEFVGDGIAVLGLDNVVGNSFRWAERRYITPLKYEQLRRYTVHGGDVLISIMGTTGRCAIVPNDIPTAINTKHLCAVTLDNTVAHPEFVRGAFLWHPASRHYLVRETKGAIMAGLNMGIIKAMPIPLPPLAEQQAFAKKVEAIQAERSRVARALDADDELFAALQHCAFRGEL